MYVKKVNCSEWEQISVPSRYSYDNIYIYIYFLIYQLSCKLDFICLLILMKLLACNYKNVCTSLVCFMLHYVALMQSFLIPV